MADKVLIQTNLTETAITDTDGVGNVYRHKKKEYIFVKNACATALTKKEPAFYTDKDRDRVTVTRAKNLLAGVPVTAIAASGSTVTGAFGWVQKAGVVEDAVLIGTDTAQAVGAVFVGSTGAFCFKSAAGTAPGEVSYAYAVTAVAATSGAQTENSTDVMLVCP